MEEAASNNGWFKSSRSGAAGHCVGVKFLENNGVAVRHTQDPDGPMLRFTGEEWSAFIDGAKDGEFDRQ